MQSFVIEGGHPLRGEVTPSGNKNAALPLIAACLLTDQPILLRNLPDIGDVRTMRALVEALGVSVEASDGPPGKARAGQAPKAALPTAPDRRLRGTVSPPFPFA